MKGKTVNFIFFRLILKGREFGAYTSILAFLSYYYFLIITGYPLLINLKMQIEYKYIM